MVGVFYAAGFAGNCPRRACGAQRDAHCSGRCPLAAAFRPDLARAMIVGIPNSGKSSIVNALLRRGAAKTEARAGVTRQAQWFRLRSSVELMDTPGVLPPKIHGAQAQWKLAICGAVPRERYDPQEVAKRFHEWLAERKPRTQVPRSRDVRSTARFCPPRRAHRLSQCGAVVYQRVQQRHFRPHFSGESG